MSIENEDTLEKNLIKQLKDQNFTYINVKNEEDLVKNFKRQIEILNWGIKTDLLTKEKLKDSFGEYIPKRELTNNEFNELLNNLNKGNIFERAKILRQKKISIKNELDDKNPLILKLLNQKNWCDNIFQVANQIEMKGKYLNRYDVTILINGLPLVCIELKRRGNGLDEAFNQIVRYKKHSYETGEGSGLFSYIQLFIISNGENTQYFANNKEISRRITHPFFWSDKDNIKITTLEEFTKDFLKPCFLCKVIGQYIVLHNDRKELIVLRPYQIHAIQGIMDHIENSKGNCYIWHTTGSGKTITSFKTSQLLENNSKIDKVVFVVDRKDLDYQTTKEFNELSNVSIDGTENTQTLINHLLNDEKRLILTTIQKLDRAIKRDSFKLNEIKEKRIIFIFDECHRGQFGDSHMNIKKFFVNNQMIGFTGTPIFDENAQSDGYILKTTNSVFDKCLHKYQILDGINDGNVLKFNVEIRGEDKIKDNHTIENKKTNNIDIKEYYSNNNRLTKISKFILENHKIKTNNKMFSGIFAISDIDTLVKYYDILKEENEKIEDKKERLKITAIFSYNANEDDKSEISINNDLSNEEKLKTNRDKLDEIMSDYNKLFKTNFNTSNNPLSDYSNDISRKLRENKIDILLVVDMFLTGYDSPTLQTLYLDKNLKFHRLIQAFSRTNRIYPNKPFGNIVSFRNIKEDIDNALLLYSTTKNESDVLIQSLEYYEKEYNKNFSEIKKIYPNTNEINNILGESEKKIFIKNFGEIIKLVKTLENFSEFSFNKLDVKEKEYRKYLTKYLDLYNNIKREINSGKESIINDVDFVIDYIDNFSINIEYILKLIIKMFIDISKNNGTQDDIDKGLKDILDTLDSTPSLRLKKDLILDFIKQQNNNIKDSLSSNDSNNNDDNSKIDNIEEIEKEKREELELYLEKELELYMIQKEKEEYLKLIDKYELFKLDIENKENNQVLVLDIFKDNKYKYISNQEFSFECSKLTDITLKKVGVFKKTKFCEEFKEELKNIFENFKDY